MIRAFSKKCQGIKFRKVGDEQGEAGTALFICLKKPEIADWFYKALVAEGIRIGTSSGCKSLLHDKMVLEKKQMNPLSPPFGAGFDGQSLKYHPQLCPNTDLITSKMVCIAIGVDFTDKDIEDIEKAIIKVWTGMVLTKLDIA